MTPKTARSGSVLQTQRRCAVFKVDRSGHFVYIDALSEQLFGLPLENLYARSIEEFLDEKSFLVLQKIFSRSRSFEVVYEPVDLVFINSDNRPLRHKAVVSLNFSAGNPANYQVIVIPEEEVESQRVEVYNDGSGDTRVTNHLIEFISNTDPDVRWNELVDILLELPAVRQAGLYLYDNDRLTLLASATRRPYSGIGIDFSITGESHLTAACSLKPYTIKQSENCIEYAYPLIGGDRCWGLLRLILAEEDLPDYTFIENICAFIGNVIGHFTGKEESRVASQIGDDTIIPAFIAKTGEHTARIGESIESLSAQFDRELKGYGREYLDTLRGSHVFLARAADRIGRMLELSRDIQFSESVDLNRVVRDVLDHLGVEYPSVRVRLNDFSLPVINTDSHVAREIIKSVLENCFQFRNPAELLEIDINCVKNNDKLELGISDNGPGIPDNTADRVFEPFFARTVYVGSHGSGLGLGLTVAGRLAQLLGGEVRLSRGTKGASFIIELPL